MIKAVFMDIDGTLTNSNRKITDRTKNAIKKCVEKGIKIILTSGRSRQRTIECQKEIGASSYIISSNGADIYDIENDKEIYSKPILKDVTMKLLEYAQKNNYKIILNYESNMVMNMSYYPDEEDKVRTIEELKNIIQNKKIVQCVILNRKLENLKVFKEYLNKEITEVKIENESKRLKNPNLKPSSHYYCDITSKEISKGKAVEVLCEYLHMEKQDIVAIGDGENDISMFKVAKNSVAMGNATENVKKHALLIASSNDEEGVANFLEQLLTHNLNLYLKK